MPRAMMARNEIFEKGQHVGMTGSGHMADRFDGVGKIVSTDMYPNSPLSPHIKVQLERQDGTEVYWFLDRILDFNLYEDEVTNAIETQ